MARCGTSTTQPTSTRQAHPHPEGARAQTSVLAMPSGLMSSVHVPSLAEAIASPQASADALASALRSDATPLCLELLSQAAVALVQEAPDAVASLLNFFLAAARTCPLAIAAGLDSGELFNASTMHSFEKLPGALRTSAVKASLDLMCVVAEQGLPSSMLRSRLWRKRCQWSTKSPPAWLAVRMQGLLHNNNSNSSSNSSKGNSEQLWEKKA